MIRKLKKWIAYVIGLAILTGLLGPLFIGIWLSSHYQSFLQSVNHSPSPVSMRLVRFERGWFHSKAEVVVLVESPGIAAPGGTQFALHQTIWQGPILMRRQDSIFPHVYFGKALVQNTLRDPVMRGMTDWLLCFNHEWKGWIQQLNGQWMSPPSDWLYQGLTGEVQGNTVGAVNGQLHLNHMSITTAVPMESRTAAPAVRSQIVTLDEVNTQFNITPYQNALWLGEHHTQIAHVWVQNGGGMPFAAANLDIAVDAAVDDGKLSVSTTGHIDSLQDDQYAFKPVNWVLSLTDVDAASMVKLSQQSKRVQQQLTGVRSQQAQMLALFSLMGPALDVLKHGLAFTVSEFTASNTQGQLQVSGHMLIPPAEDMQKSNWAAMMANVQAELHMQMPQAFLTQLLGACGKDCQHTMGNMSAPATPAETTRSPQIATPTFASTATPSVDSKPYAAQQVATWVKAGVLVAQGNLLVLDFAFSHNQATLNGRPFSEVMNALMPPPQQSEAATPAASASPGVTTPAAPSVPATTAPAPAQAQAQAHATPPAAAVSALPSAAPAEKTTATPAGAKVGS